MVRFGSRCSWNYNWSVMKTLLHLLILLITLCSCGPSTEFEPEESLDEPSI
jgi:hypothetical protein